MRPASASDEIVNTHEYLGRTMKFRTILGAITVMGTFANRLDASVTFYLDVATWFNGASYYAAMAPDTLLVVDTLEFAAQTGPTAVTSGANGNGIHSWADWTATTTSGASLALTASGNPGASITASPGGSDIKITFDPATQPTSPMEGVMGAGLALTYDGPAHGMDSIIVSFQNGLSSTIALPAQQSLFVGIWNENPMAGNWLKIESMTVSTTGSGALSVDSIYVGLVPSPGAIGVMLAAAIGHIQRRRRH